MSDHPSSSAVQCAAEQILIAGASSQIAVPLTKATLQICGCKVEIDGFNELHRVACEAYSHVGPLKAGQSRKLATDVLKLAMVDKHLGEGCRKIIVVAGAEAHAWLTGKCWQAGAVRQFGIEVMRVELPANTHAEVLATQTLQFR